MATQTLVDVLDRVEQRHAELIDGHRMLTEQYAALIERHMAGDVEAGREADQNARIRANLRWQASVLAEFSRLPLEKMEMVADSINHAEMQGLLGPTRLGRQVLNDRRSGS